MSHLELLDISQTLKRFRPSVSVLVLENSQAVTGYSLPHLRQAFFQNGVDGLLCGDPYHNWDEIATWLCDPSEKTAPVNLLSSKAPGEKVVRRLSDKNAAYPIPAWELFPVERYWSLPYAHGPKTGRYLPMLTSRGCPYPCDFCVVPETNEQRWRAHAAVDVVDEMITLHRRFGVRHFHIEDLNPTVQHRRWTEISHLLIERDAGVFFYFTSGTKAETVRLDQVGLLAQAGCRYISISPESGSKDVLKVVRKPFDYDHGLRLVAACRENGIRTQACFLVGHPAETKIAHQQSRDYLTSMLRHGLDEVAVFIVASFAGSALFAREEIAISDSHALPSFSPRGREDFALYQKRRSELIWLFFREKMKQGSSLWMQGVRAVIGRPQTKMENLPRRFIYIWILIFLNRFGRLVSRRSS
jgi:hypothetical protein